MRLAGQRDALCALGPALGIVLNICWVGKAGGRPFPDLSRSVAELTLSPFENHLSASECADKSMDCEVWEFGVRLVPPLLTEGIPAPPKRQSHSDLSELGAAAFFPPASCPRLVFSKCPCGSLAVSSVECLGCLLCAHPCYLGALLVPLCGVKRPPS